MNRVSIFICFAAPAILILLLEFFGAWTALGAHPWWSFKGALTGVAIGFLVMTLLTVASRFGNISDPLLVLAFAGLALVALILMLNGKESFATSYARDAISGRFWYFGYIGFSAALYAAASCACRAALVRPRP